MIQEGNNSNPVKINDKNEASIQVSLNGLSFCIINREKGSVLYYKKVPFKKRLTPTEALQQIKLLYAKEKSLQQPIGKASIIFANDLYTLVPHIFFNEENAPDYLKYNAKILQTDFVAHDLVAKPQIVNVYIPYANISNYFFDLYGEFEYRHSISIFLDAILHFKDVAGTKMYVNINHESFDLAVVEHGKLLLCNTFFFETKEDFMYYILFTAEQLKLDPNEFELVLMGQIEKVSDLHKIAYTYVRQVTLYEEEQTFAFETEEKPHLREEFILMKSFLHEDSLRNA